MVAPTPIPAYAVAGRPIEAEIGANASVLLNGIVGVGAMGGSIVVWWEGDELMVANLDAKVLGVEEVLAMLLCVLVFLVSGLISHLTCSLLCLNPD